MRHPTTKSGKSKLLEETLPRLFGKLSLFSTKSSMAGLMQSIGHTAKIAILDEFESGKERKAILELARTSGRGGKIFRGTPNQKANTYGLKHIVWLGAIETGLSDAADRNRFILLHLKTVKKKKGDKMLQLPPADELADLGLRSLAVAVSCWKDVKARAKVLYETIIEDVDHRIIESYSVPCAMLGVTLGQDTHTTIGIMKAVLEGRDLVGQQVSDEQFLLEEIFESVVFTGSGKQCTVSQAILAVGSEGVEREAAERCGVRSYEDKESGNEHIFFVPPAIRRHLLKDSDFKWKQIGEILARVNMAKMSRQRMSGKNPRGWSIPKSAIVKMLGDEQGENESTGTSSKNLGSFGQY